jgi:O-succinylbenzoate synthase
MKIEAIELRYCRLPLRIPWRTSYGVDTEIHTILVRVFGGGAEGWGESSPLRAPIYSSECAPSVFAVLEEFFLPTIVGQTIDHPGEVLERLKHFRGNPFAKAGIEAAVWDLEAQLRQVPLNQLWGGTRTKVDCGADFAIHDSLDVLLGLIQGAINNGYQRVKLKISHGHDVEVVRAVRQTFPKLIFHVDCNSCYDLRRDLAALKEMDKYGLAMIEQPLGHSDLVDHAALQKQLETPICLDESITGVREFEQALRLGSCRVVNVKFPRVGGFTNALAIERLAREAGMPAWVGGMLESSIGAAMSIELAALPGFTYPNDLFPSSYLYGEDLTDRNLEQDAECRFAVSTAPGTGYRPNLERIERLTAKRVRFGK